jgi:hypothetical protein
MRIDILSCDMHFTGMHVTCRLQCAYAHDLTNCMCGLYKWSLCTCDVIRISNIF